MLIRCRSSFTLVAILLIVTIWGVPTHSNTQDLETATGLLDVDDIDGIQQAGARSYAMDIAKIADTVDDATLQAPDPDGPMLMIVARFDAPKNASDNVETIQDHFLDELNADNIGFQIEAMEIVGMRNTAIRITGTGSDQHTTVSGSIVQDHEWLYVAIALITNNTSDDAARDLIDFAATHASGPENIQYDHTGGSTGSLWNKLPGKDDTDATSGTVPVFDNYLLPPEGDVSTL